MDLWTFFSNFRSLIFLISKFRYLHFFVLYMSELKTNRNFSDSVERDWRRERSDSWVAGCTSECPIAPNCRDVLSRGNGRVRRGCLAWGCSTARAAQGICWGGVNQTRWTQKTGFPGKNTTYRRGRYKISTSWMMKTRIFWDKITIK